MERKRTLAKFVCTLYRLGFGAVVVLGSFGQGNAQQQVSQPMSLINGRTITPVGHSVQLAPFPFAITVSADGKQLVAPSIGWPFSLNIIDNPASETSSLRRIAAAKKSDHAVEVHTGVAYSLDGKRLYDATGDSGAVDVLSAQDWHRVARVPLDGTFEGKKVGGSFAASLVLSTDGRWLYVVDQGNWRVVVINTQTLRCVESVATGVNPFAVALSPDGRRLYVSNSGLFEYRLIGPRSDEEGAKTGLRFPPSGYPSQATREGSVVEGHAVLGLGDENDPRGSSLWSYDLSKPEAPVVTAKLRLGDRITEKPKGVVGGASPSGIAAGGEHVYVALAHTDAVAVVSVDGRHLDGQIALSPFTGMLDGSGRMLRGVSPQGLALGGNGLQDRLYVAESGINAVAVIDTRTNRVLGHIPTGWYPAAVAVSRTTATSAQTLYILSNKGKGAGPNFLNGERRYIGELEYGSLAALPTADLEQRLPEYTAQVIRNNEAGLAVAPAMPAVPVHHVFLIIRENRTFDEMLGDLPGADGDAPLARYGEHGWASEDARIKDVNVSPNAHAVARAFATSDRFSTDSDVSADGHRWAVGIAPTPWMNIAWTSGYGGRRRGKVDSDAPGRRALSGGADAPMPEDEPEFGSLWEHVAGAGLGVLNYGEGLELEGSDERTGDEPEGQRLYLNSPAPKPVFTSSDRVYPTFNLGIPDQLRFEEFRRDFTTRLEAETLPALIVIRLPGDHTADPRPGDGYPFRASYIADNDLALGRIIDFISHSKVWKDSAIFAIEDDAQGGADHVDAHRSVLLAVSPYIRKNFVSHTLTSMVSVQKTIYSLLGVGALNLEDGLASGLGDMFTTTPDFRPFNFVTSDLRVFDPAKAKVAHPKNSVEARKLLDCDDAGEIGKEFHRHRISRKDDD
jgi:YVTN family beta-propeller protein